jgi:serine/threonine-protein kinase HipA
MKYICRSSLQNIEREGYTAISQKQLSGSNRQFPYRLSFARSDIISFRSNNIEHMSISGVQDKISLKLDRGGILSPTEKHGEYILKPIPSTPLPCFHEDVPANEHLTMQTAKQIFNIAIPPNACVEFSDGEPAYIVKRFDRLPSGRKIAQEDFCQLSGRTPEKSRNYKYESSYEELGQILKKYCGAYRIEILKLFKLISFNYIFSNGDAHLKNFSLKQTIDGDYLLAPGYDLLCTSMHLPNEARTALEMFESHETNFHKNNAFYGRPDFIELAHRFGIDKNRADSILNLYAAKQQRVFSLIENSFMSKAAKEDYKSRFIDRLRTIS